MAKVKAFKAWVMAELHDLAKSKSSAKAGAAP